MEMGGRAIIHRADSVAALEEILATTGAQHVVAAANLVHGLSWAEHWLYDTDAVLVRVSNAAAAASVRDVLSARKVAGVHLLTNRLDAHELARTGALDSVRDLSIVRCPRSRLPTAEFLRALPGLVSLGLPGLMASPDAVVELALSAGAVERLDLSRNSLNDTHIVQLAPHLDKLIHLNLSHNEVGPRGATEIAAHATKLESLDLEGNQIADEGTLAIAVKLDSLTRLNLGGNQIGPDGANYVAWRLSRLTELNLGKNQVGTHAAGTLAAGLPQLRSFNLDTDELGPAALDALGRYAPGLSRLSVDGSAIGDEGVAMIADHLPHLTHLGIWNTSIGDEGAAAIAARLGNLTHLSAGNNDIGPRGAAAIASGLSNLVHLHLGSNPIGPAGAASIAELLPTLVRLNLGACGIGDEGTHALAHNLTGVEHLNLWQNRIGDLGAQAIGASLRHLLHLNLDRNQVRDTGAEALAGGLGQLCDLQLWDNEISSAGAQALARGLPHLNFLDLMGNRVGDQGATAVVRNLANLAHLDLASNGITDEGAEKIAAHLPQLPELTAAVLGDNTIGPVGLRSIAAVLPATNLTALSLVGDPIDDEGAIEVAAHMRHLTFLDLSETGIRDAGAQAVASALPGATLLKSLSLRMNEIGAPGIEAVADVLRDRPPPSLLTLDLRDNPGIEAAAIPELLETDDARALTAALRRLEAAEDEGGMPFSEAKLILLGAEYAGKTSLVRALVDGEPCRPNEPKTPGVRHEIWTPGWTVRSIDDQQQIRINVWDFGGQEILHQTHRYFLSERSIYVIVLDSRREDDRTVYSWLRTIEARSPESPVIVAINKCDNGVHNLDIDFEQLQREHPQIVKVLPVSCIAGEVLDRSLGPNPSVQPLRSTIVDLLEHDDRLDSVRRVVPAAWVRVRDEIRSMAADLQVLEGSRYIPICLGSDRPEMRVDDPDEQRALLRLLHQTGVVVAHGLSAGTRSIADLTLLDPNWLTEAIYALLADPSVLAGDGLFDRAVLGEALARRGLDMTSYAPNRLDFIIDLMCMPDLGLAFPVREREGSEATYLLPEALSPTAPASTSGWDPTSLRLRYRYADLARSLIPQFQVAAHEHFGDDPARWRSGCTLEVDGCPVLVDAHPGHHLVEIRVAGPAGRRRDALAVVRSLFFQVHKRMPETRAQERVPLPLDDELDVAYDHLVRLEDAYGGEHRFLPEGATHEYQVSDLLNGVRHQGTGPARADGANVNVVVQVDQQAPQPVAIDGDEATRLATWLTIAGPLGGILGAGLYLAYWQGGSGDIDLSKLALWASLGAILIAVVTVAGWTVRRPR